jgi:hypothetical protein
MSENGSREKHIEVRWVGDEKTEVAFLRAIGRDDAGEVAKGSRERCMRIPAKKSAAALQALTASGARVLNPEP